MIEPVQGEGGIRIPPDGFLAGLRRLCDERDLLLIFDEVQSGCGRTGTWFAYQKFDVTPDIMTLAKSLCGGVAGGALLTTPEIAPSLRPGMHAATFGGNPLAARAGIAYLETIENEHLLERANQLSDISTTLRTTARRMRTDPRSANMRLDARPGTNHARCTDRSGVHGASLIDQLYPIDRPPTVARHEPDGKPGSRRLRYSRRSAQGADILEQARYAMPQTEPVRHLLTLSDLSSAEIERIFAVTEDLKTKYEEGLREPILPGRVMALLFEKPSLRTRVSFETAMINLGGGSVFLREEAGWGQRESLADFGRVLSQYVDVIVIRANRHRTIAELARHCECSVINGLTDYSHPCQVLADLYTLREQVGRLAGHKLAYVGDGNNVARSLAVGCGRMGMKMSVAAPEGYQFEPEFHEFLARELPDFELTVTTDPAEAVRDATAIYTDVWTSMGQESEAETRRKVFAPYQVNAQLLSHAPSHASFMHCLPAHREEEVTAEVIDGPQSIVVQQAGNRLHVQKGILAWLLGPQA